MRDLLQDIASLISAATFVFIFSLCIGALS